MNGGHPVSSWADDQFPTVDSRYPDVTTVIIDMINTQTHNTDIA